MLTALPAALKRPLSEKHDQKSNEAMVDDVVVILDEGLNGGLSPPSSVGGCGIPPPLAGSHSRNTSLNSNIDTNPSSDSATHTSNGTHSNFHYSDGSFLPYTPRHSDFTIPTSNQGRLLVTPSPEEEDEQEQTPRRSIFGNAVQRKYRTDASNQWGGGVELLNELPPAEHDAYHVNARHERSAFVSDVTLPDLHGYKSGPKESLKKFAYWVKSIFSSNHHDHNHVRRKSSELDHQPAGLHRDPSTSGIHKTRRKRPHETVHAQSLLLGLAFCAVWSANNVMAPNLTEMADFFGLQGAAERDLYLGSYCALATGVFSFPIAAGIGVLADLMSRQQLFCITVAGGGISALVTARSKSYPVLFITRLINGGFMAGSTPVAFSFLGDLFSVEERNAASSGLTAMMGLGIILGQVYAGMMGPTLGWQHAFYVSGILALSLAVLCLLLVQEPVRGGKEKVLQDMIKAGTRYDRKLTWSGFIHAVRHNESNSILLWQGFFSSLPWGVIFVFLNDYLSQERGFSVPAATYLVFLFGLGCAAGGVLGGYWGQLVQRYNRSYLPLFMSFTTLLGVLPFVGLLNTHFTRAHGVWGILLSVSSGLVASLPSVNVRPCLINVNPPETRGASLTAANLLISLGRGVGPSCVTLMGSIFQANRTFSINVTLILFWVISAIQLAMLARTLPSDQDRMEAELASYAQAAMERHASNDDFHSDHCFSISSLPEDHDDGDQSIEVSIEDRMTYFDGTAARQTLIYVKEGMEEFRQQLATLPFACGDIPESSEEEESPNPTPNASSNGPLDGGLTWKGDGRVHFPNETTPLVV